MDFNLQILVILVALAGCYLLVLGMSAVGAAVSHMGRTGVKSFPLAHCLRAACIPAAFVLAMTFGLMWWGLSRDGAEPIFTLLMIGSFYVSSRIERRLALPADEHGCSPDDFRVERGARSGRAGRSGAGGIAPR
jgi:hypothetical protein